MEREVDCAAGGEFWLSSGGVGVEEGAATLVAGARGSEVLVGGREDASAPAFRAVVDTAGGPGTRSQMDLPGFGVGDSCVSDCC
jgi:hypothetical protein